MLIRQGTPIAWLQFAPVYRCMLIAPIACGSNSHVSLTLEQNKEERLHLAPIVCDPIPCQCDSGARRSLWFQRNGEGVHRPMLASNGSGQSHKSKSQHANQTGTGSTEEPTKCVFCNVSIAAPDDEDPSTTMRWQYPDGTGAACFYCNRTFQADYQHDFQWQASRFNNGDKQTSVRDQVVATTSKDNDELDKFLGRRRQLLHRRKDKELRRQSKPSQVRKTVAKKRSYREDLLPPPPDFLPWEDYEKKYGMLQKKAGHVKRTVNGVKGVVIPAAEGTPWKVGAFDLLACVLCAWISVLQVFHVVCIHVCS